MSDGGKGSAPRPFSVDLNTFDNNWDTIFRKPKPQTDKQDDIPKNQPNNTQHSDVDS